MVQNLAVRIKNVEEDQINNNFKNVQVEDIGLQEPGDEEVTVKVVLRPVNPTDLITARGLYPGLKEKVPYTGGSEGVGTIEKLGGKVKNFSKGQRVVGLGFASWAQFVNIEANKLKLVPDEVKDETAAQFFVNPTTVLGLVETAAVPEGHYLLQGAAGSTLGKMLIQYTNKLNIKTINVVRRAEQVKELKDLGADEVINSSKEDVVARVREITGGKGAYTALDPIAGDFTNTLLACIRPFGSVIVYGALSGTSVNFPVMSILPVNKAVVGFILLQWLSTLENDQERANRFDKAMSLLANGTFTPQKGEVFPLEKVHEAMAASTKVGRGAKVFLQ